MSTTPSCPACGASMRLRNSARGPFYGCTRYPACRATVDAAGAGDNGAPTVARGVPLVSAEAAAEALAAHCTRLDPFQAAVAGWRPADGNLQVVAGAGSGKTFTVVGGVGQLVRDGVPPDRIIVTTFTRKAGDELAERTAKVVPAAAFQQLRIGTFHGLALRALRAAQPGRWPMQRCLDLGDRAAGLPGTGLLWKQVCGWGTIRGTNLSGLDLDDAEEAARDFSGAVEILRAHGIRPGDLDLRIRFRALLGEYVPDCVAAWRLFEAAKRELEAWDFGDVLFAYWRGLRSREIADSADVVIVDEAQDNSWLQLEIARLLAAGGRLILVGDSRQCIPAGEPILTPDGPRPVETIKMGDRVLASVAGALTPRHVLAVGRQSPVGRTTYRFTTETGRSFATTGDHVIFAALGKPAGFYVYLMWRAGYGFRVGASQASGDRGLRNVIVRTQQEAAERLWILGIAEDRAAAHRLEHTTAYDAGVPMDPFKPRPGGAFTTADAAAAFFRRYEANGAQLLRDRGLDFDRPVYIAKSSSRGRVAVNLNIGTDNGAQVSVESREIRGDVAADYEFTSGRRGCWRLRRWFADPADAGTLAEMLVAAAPNAYRVETLSLPGADRRVFTTRAAGLFPGMLVPEADPTGHVRLVAVTAREIVPAGVAVYDLEVEGAANFAVNGIVVHNCIYTWRGAYPETFMRADEEIDARRAELPRNYRSGTRIVAVGNAVAADQDWSLGAVTLPARDVEGLVRVLPAAHTPGDCARDVARRVREELEAGGKADDTAILCRTNAVAGLFSAALVAERVPCVVVGGTPFFARADVQDALAYLVLARIDALNSLLRIRNRPKRYLGKAFDEAVTAAFALTGDIPRAIRDVAPTLRGGARVGAEDLADTIERLRGLPWNVDAADREVAAGADRTAPCDVPDAIVALLMPAKDDREADEDREGILTTLAATARGFEGPESLIGFAKACLADAATASEDGALPPGRVTVSTIHRAKGREWATVYVHAAAGIFPHRRSVSEKAIAEERRLFYVAATRAKDSLFFAYNEVDDREREAGLSWFVADFVRPHETPTEGPGKGPNGGGSKADPAADAPETPAAGEEPCGEENGSTRRAEASTSAKWCPDGEQPSPATPEGPSPSVRGEADHAGVEPAHHALPAGSVARGCRMEDPDVQVSAIRTVAATHEAPPAPRVVEASPEAAAEIRADLRCMVAATPPPPDDLIVLGPLPPVPASSLAGKLRRLIGIGPDGVDPLGELTGAAEHYDTGVDPRVLAPPTPSAPRLCGSGDPELDVIVDAQRRSDYRRLADAVLGPPGPHCDNPSTDELVDAGLEDLHPLGIDPAVLSDVPPEGAPVYLSRVTGTYALREEDAARDADGKPIRIGTVDRAPEEARMELARVIAERHAAHTGPDEIPDAAAGAAALARIRPRDADADPFGGLTGAARQAEKMRRYLEHYGGRLGAGEAKEVVVIDGRTYVADVSPAAALRGAARALARERTDAEPRARGTGEGSRFVDVAASSFDELLRPLGFVEAPADRRGQRAWIRETATPVGVVAEIVYSTIPIGAEVGRACGNDSIRVALVFAPPGGSRALMKQPWVARTRGWRLALLDRLDTVAAHWRICPRCGGPAVLREGTRGAFYGCVQYPACKGTVALDAAPQGQE